MTFLGLQCGIVRCFLDGKDFELVTMKTYKRLSSNDVFFSVVLCNSLVKTGVEKDTNSEEAKHDSVGASAVFLMWCCVVITEITIV